MIRDCAGLDSSAEDAPELDSAGPGEGERCASSVIDSGLRVDCAGSLGSFALVVIGSEESLRLFVCSASLPDAVLSGRGDELPASRRTAVLADVFRETKGRADA